MSTLILALAAGTASADPCGMITTNVASVGIERAGEQRTYVFHRDGVESIAIRPGFIGTIEDFGMLIPFPTPPAIRKLNDDVFAHITAAVDPPEVVVQRVGRWQRPAVAPPASSNDETPAVALEPGLHLRVGEQGDREVRVHREEAVGMYEVAVLEAGSTDALATWMARNGYRYPEGMELAIRDYLDDGWVFVAVKARVDRLTTPQPGMRHVDNRKPDGAVFAGHVQAMGFRFDAPSPVVPMRLSTFNGGDLHNVVYLLTDEPVRFDGIDGEFVARQVPGSQVRANLTELLPLRVEASGVAGTFHAQRDPSPYTRVAASLFASDIAASTQGRLALGSEEHDKGMARISAALHVGHTSVLEEAAVHEEHADDTADALSALDDLTLTVIDGDFPRDFLRDNNLTVSAWAMPDDKNNRGSYDARVGRDGTASAD